MKDKCFDFILRILPFAFGAVISLAIFDAVDLGYQTIGNGPGTIAPIIGDSVGLLVCGTFAVIGFRQLRSGPLRQC